MIDAQEGAKPFITPEQRKKVFVPKWQEAVRVHYDPKELHYPVMECRLVDKNYNLGNRFENSEQETVNAIHGFDLLEEVIPRHIEQRNQSGMAGKIRILDLGTGMAFVSDQIRTRWKDKVEVYGTNLMSKRQVKKKKEIYRAIKSGEIPMSDEDRSRLLSQISENYHPNDNIVRSILEMKDFPEFDIIIDTCGEMYYSGDGYRPDQTNTLQVFTAAIKKLNPGGEFFIGRVLDTFILNELFKKAKVIESKYPIELRQNPKALWDTSFVVKKGEKNT